MQSGSDLKHLVLFDKGQPTSNIDYSLKRSEGTEIASGSLSVSNDQLSVLIEVAGSLNTLTKPLYEQLSLTWSYTTQSEAISGSYSYRLEAPIPYSVSTQGVRDLLGTTVEELPDEAIKLFSGYIDFIQPMAPLGIEPPKDLGDASSYQIAQAIEATTALGIIPSLAIRLARRYSSGTSEYERWNDVDWDELKLGLQIIAYKGLEAIDDRLVDQEVPALFVLSNLDTDPITGA